MGAASPFNREDPPNEFDPEGAGYDYKTAIESGGKPGPDGHWGSLDPRTGMVLKGKKHPTWSLMEQEERKRGSSIVRQPNKRYYSVPRKKSSKKKP